MRVSREQFAENRQRILEVAGRLFREKGFEGVGVDGIMEEAGLTHGGFYGHFASKDDLAAEITAEVFGREAWLEWLTGKTLPSIAEVVRGYLTPRHRDDPGHGCFAAALGTEVARQPRSVRRAFTGELHRRLEILKDLVPGRSAAARRRQAIAMLAGLVGALILSRAVDDPQFSEEILETVAAAALERA